MKKLQDIDINIETGTLDIDILKKEKPFIVVVGNEKA